MDVQRSSLGSEYRGRLICVQLIKPYVSPGCSGNPVSLDGLSSESALQHHPGGDCELLSSTVLTGVTHRPPSGRGPVRNGPSAPSRKKLGKPLEKGPIKNFDHPVTTTVNSHPDVHKTRTNA